MVPLHLASEGLTRGRRRRETPRKLSPTENITPAGDLSRRIPASVAKEAFVAAL